MEQLLMKAMIKANNILIVQLTSLISLTRGNSVKVFQKTMIMIMKLVSFKEACQIHELNNQFVERGC
jgi:flagellar motor component MotA